MNAVYQLPFNHALHAISQVLEHHPVAAEQVISGKPSVGISELGELTQCTIGVWEITPGISTDIEVHEFFVVLSGHAVVRFADGTPDLHLQPGSVGHLAAGAHTTWIVSETLRKIYIASNLS